MWLPGTGIHYVACPTEDFQVLWLGRGSSCPNTSSHSITTQHSWATPDRSVIRTYARQTSSFFRDEIVQNENDEEVRAYVSVKELSVAESCGGGKHCPARGPLHKHSLYSSVWP